MDKAGYLTRRRRKAIGWQLTLEQKNLGKTSLSAAIKGDNLLKDITLARNSRLSVSPLQGAGILSSILELAELIKWLNDENRKKAKTLNLHKVLNVSFATHPLYCIVRTENWAWQMGSVTARFTKVASLSQKNVTL